MIVNMAYSVCEVGCSCSLSMRCNAMRYTFRLNHFKLKYHRFLSFLHDMWNLNVWLRITVYLRCLEQLTYWCQHSIIVKQSHFYLFISFSMLRIFQFFFARRKADAPQMQQTDHELNFKENRAGSYGLRQRREKILLNMPSDIVTEKKY